MDIRYDQWLNKRPDAETVAALATLEDCRYAKQRAKENGCMADWVALDRMERKAEAFLRG